MKRESVRNLVMAAQLVSLLFGFAACGEAQEEDSIPDVAAQSTPLPSKEPSKSAAVADGTEGNILRILKAVRLRSRCFSPTLKRILIRSPISGETS